MDYLFTTKMRIRLAGYLKGDGKSYVTIFWVYIIAKVAHNLVIRREKWKVLEMVS